MQRSSLAQPCQAALLCWHWQRDFVPPTVGRSGGFALLGTALLVVLFAATASLHILHGAVPAYDRVSERLGYARAALLGYAASYADQHVVTLGNGVGPGYLPCPDIDGDGSPDAACAPSATGMLPWRRLGLMPARTFALAPIHYAISDRYRNNPRKSVPINMDSSGELDSAGNRSAVALLSLPRTGPLGGARWPVYGSAISTQGAFQNAIQRSVQTRSVSSLALGRVIEMRAMLEVERAIRLYQRAPWNPNHEPPWLRPWSQAGLGQVGTYRGQLAVHARGSFESGFRIQWRDVKRHQVGGSRREATSAAGSVGGLTVTVRNGRCVWRSYLYFGCTGDGVGIYGAERSGIYRAEVSFDFFSAQAQIHAPHETQVRTRSAKLVGPMPSPGHIVVRMFDDRGAPVKAWAREVRSRHAARSISIFATRRDAPVDFSVSDVQFALDPSFEIGAWFLHHSWDRLLQIGFGAAFVPGGHGQCDAAGCLRLRDYGAYRLVPAVVVSGGASPDRRPLAGPVGTRFERMNASPGTAFTRAPGDASFNDRLRVLSLVPRARP